MTEKKSRASKPHSRVVKLPNVKAHEPKLTISKFFKPLPEVDKEGSRDDPTVNLSSIKVQDEDSVVSSVQMKFERISDDVIVDNDDDDNFILPRLHKLPKDKSVPEKDHFQLPKSSTQPLATLGRQHDIVTAENYSNQPKHNRHIMRANHHEDLNTTKLKPMKAVAVASDCLREKSQTKMRHFFSWESSSSLRPLGNRLLRRPSKTATTPTLSKSDASDGTPSPRSISKRETPCTSSIANECSTPLTDDAFIAATHVPSGKRNLNSNPSYHDSLDQTLFVLPRVHNEISLSNKDAIITSTNTSPLVTDDMFVPTQPLEHSGGASSKKKCRPIRQISNLNSLFQDVSADEPIKRVEPSKNRSRHDWSRKRQAFSKSVTKRTFCFFNMTCR
jgi:hypothetical protein